MRKVNEILSEKIRQCRQSEGLTQAQLAEKVHVSTQAVSRWEKGGMPDICMLAAIADCLHVSTDYLLGRQENPTANVGPDIVKSLSCIPKAKRFEKAYEYAWASVIGTSDASDSMKDMFAAQPSLNSEEGNGYLMQSIMPEGFAIGEMTKGSRFLFLAPEPDNPYSSQEAYIRYFRLLSDPANFRILSFLLTKPIDKVVTSSLIADRTGLSQEQVDLHCQILARHHFLICQKIEDEKGDICVYSGIKKPWIAAILIILSNIIEDDIITLRLTKQDNAPFTK